MLLSHCVDGDAGHVVGRVEEVPENVASELRLRRKRGLVRRSESKCSRPNARVASHFSLTNDACLKFESLSSARPTNFIVREPVGANLRMAVTVAS